MKVRRLSQSYYRSRPFGKNIVPSLMVKFNRLRSVKNPIGNIIYDTKSGTTIGGPSDMWSEQ